MKGVATEVKTDIGKNDSEVDPAYVAMVRQRLMAMDPKRLARLEKKYRTITAGQESQAESENKTFNKQAGTIQDRTKSVEALKRKVMSANKKKEIKDADQITKDKASAQSKADKQKESRDKVYLDFTEVTNVRTLADEAINQIKGERALRNRELQIEYENYDKDGNAIPLDKDAQNTIDAEMQAFDAKIRSAEVKRDAEEKQKANKLIFNALQKYNGVMTIEEIGQLFAREGLGDYFIDFVNNFQQISK